MEIKDFVIGFAAGKAQGGGGSVFAFAQFLFNSGDIVTATDGSTVLNSDSSGDYVFSIPNAGLWTFTCGNQTKSYLFNKFGEKVNLSFSLLIYSNTSNIIGELYANNLDLGQIQSANINGDFYTNNYSSPLIVKSDNEIKYIETNPNSHIYIDISSEFSGGSKTFYYVGQCFQGDGQPRIITAAYDNSGYNCPGFYKNSNYVYTTVYGSDSSTGVSAYDNLFVIALSVNSITKKARFFINGQFNTQKNYSNIGQYFYLSGTSADLSDPTKTTQYGESMKICYAAIVDSCEDDSVILNNMNNLMSVYKINV